MIGRVGSMPRWRRESPCRVAQEPGLERTIVRPAVRLRTCTVDSYGLPGDVLLEAHR